MNTQVSVKSTKNTTPEVQTHAAHRTVVPEYRILRNEDRFELTAHLPGVSQSNLELHLEGPFLKIKGSMNKPQFNGFKRVHTEFSYVDYEGSFRLSDDIDREAIKAELDQGVLKVTLPKAAEVLPKKIPVNIASV